MIFHPGQKAKAFAPYSLPTNTKNTIVNTRQIQRLKIHMHHRKKLIIRITAITILTLLALIVITKASPLQIAGNISFLTANFKDLQTNEEEYLYRLKPPKEIKALYITSGTALNSTRMDSILQSVEQSGYNAVVIDVKDEEGLYIGDQIKSSVRKTIKAGIYPIARLVVFQDNFLAKNRPELAIKNINSALWFDSGGRAWLDPAHPVNWAYIFELSKKTTDLGFSEINLDYIRFPSDGDIDNTVYPFWNKIEPKETVLENFFRYYSQAIRSYEPEITLSADIFAYTFLRDDGLGIGQKIGFISKYFDTISPMIYPSHYSQGNFGFENPATEPYAVIKQTLESGQNILKKGSEVKAVIRPWIQDFNLGAIYDREKFQAQIKAIKDTGLSNGFMVWNPGNRYDITKIREDSLTAKSQ